MSNPHGLTRQRNSVVDRSLAFQRQSLYQNIIPVIELANYPPRRGALAYSDILDVIFYGDGTQWLPIPGSGGPVGDGYQTKSRVDGATIRVDLSYNITSVDAGQSPYNAALEDNIIHVQSATGPITINLPQISGLTQKATYRITDISGQASNNNITIAPFAGDAIGVPGGAPIVINSDFTTVTMYSDTVSTWYLF